MLSPRLQSLIDLLSNPDTIARVRLVRETKAVYEVEYPEAAKGKAQAAGAKRAKDAKRGDVALDSRVTPFAEWLAGQLGKSVPSIRVLIARAEYVPEDALSEIERRGNVRAVGGLLDRLVYLRRKDPTTDWRLAIDGHINPPKLNEAKMLYLVAGSALMSSDVRSHLEARPRRLFDAIITDPPFGMGHQGKANGAMTDDEHGALWAVPHMARHIKPEGVICLWCTAGTLGKWTKTVLDSGLVISGLVHWDKGPYFDKREELMLVAGHRQIAVPDPVRTIAAPTLPATAPERAVHDTPKPLELFAPIIEAFTRPGQFIFDPFAGTGVIGEAAMRAGRHYVGAELDHKVAMYAATRLRCVHLDLRVRAALEAA